ncbi:Rpp14/Pop5 family protein [Aspergillus luchuensis]|uniref:Ribonuclease P/MRP protein subunit POP5 n=1 Tax=Aspergillus kawachii TaxID=1069201 RepID=A0A146F8F9_ASPKA|nr:uncharacterized protein AKAW2_80053A [Aspergillus luchuensis]BCS04252.1 hypothetical protein AKAW2_80053A [Aspergillus luchuensis]BCS15842.1 hypothetical protein ALUC_80049A [Aspergillus luchuensis]GAA84138.1 Rpp14 family family [Aspergillus luchuensis IFO 4308]GAT22029.1 Rpp14 family family [Aspergillus luchuensis]
MVRLKHRYILLDILYPDPSTWPAATSRTKSNNSNSNSNPQSKSKSQAQLQIHSPTSDALTPGLLAKMVREEVSLMFGDYGVGRLGGAGAGGISVKYLSPATSTAIIRCPRASFRLVWTALTCMSQVPGFTEGGAKRSSSTRACVFRVIRVSGTMRKAEEEAIRRARREIVRLREAEESGVLEGLLGGLVDVGGEVSTPGTGGEGDVDLGVDVDVVMESEDDD